MNDEPEAPKDPPYANVPMELVVERDGVRIPFNTYEEIFEWAAEEHKLWADFENRAAHFRALGKIISNHQANHFHRIRSFAQEVVNFQNQENEPQAKDRRQKLETLMEVMSSGDRVVSDSPLGQSILNEEDVSKAVARLAWRMPSDVILENNQNPDHLGLRPVEIHCELMRAAAA